MPGCIRTVRQGGCDEYGTPVSHGATATKLR